MKRYILFISLIFFIFLAACSEDEVTPNERFDSYVKQWEKEEFAEMYGMISSTSAETYPTEEFVDRYAKIYEDLNISELAITFEELNEEELEAAMEEGTATLPFHVEMESIAGPIAFDYEATLNQEGEEEEKNWFVEWNPGFIFPQIKDGGEIRFDTTEPTRGEILDRNKMPLAMNGPIFDVGIVPESLGADPEQNKEQIADLLGISVESIDQALNAGWVEPNLLVPIKEIYDEAVVDQLLQIDGVMIDNATGRIYPEGKAAAHLVGYVGQITAEELEDKEPGQYGANDVIGKRGLEQLYEEQLKGEKGLKIIIEKEGEDDTLLAETPVKDGENISLTIDVNIQEEIYNSLEGDAGTAAAIDPKSGETLALVSSPAFDPNEILYGTKPNLWEELQNDEQNPILNRFSATFAPGSVIKPVTVAIGLQNGSITPEEEIEINGLTWSNGEGWGDYEVRRVSESTGPVDLKDALVRSDNIYFAMKGIEMGSEAFISGLQEFGFGEELPYEYPITPSTVSSTGEINDEVLLANSSYGQGEVEMSALHLALTYTPLLNKGNMLKPTFLVSEDTGQVWKENLLSSDQAEMLKGILREVVTNGTAEQANEAEFPISGKTGTAELKLTSEDKSGKENGWFVGYPTDDQNILIAMMVEHTEDRGGSGYTVEKVTDIFKELK
ncbi:penicillin-binding protein [Virgibacillus indicus]|uniref:serine-type D-Ala-D-Ala carboxypeptidase n=1 Tax=Virgibacillus indicus TaxID=2024554 RepID=A0A265NAK4_9BACI|nr:penicillin-binding transpeptidase domain-containing protein [Virgibacillus indicus]OZU88815.1 penicillin-binding protein [Virgibacillus indicus]